MVILYFTRKENLVRFDSNVPRFTFQGIKNSSCTSPFKRRLVICAPKSNEKRKSLFTAKELSIMVEL